MLSFAKIGFTCSKISACGTAVAPIFNTCLSPLLAALLVSLPQPAINSAPPRTTVAANAKNLFIQTLSFSRKLNVI